jgi:hypothetical protein
MPAAGCALSPGATCQGLTFIEENHVNPVMPGKNPLPGLLHVTGVATGFVSAGANVFALAGTLTGQPEIAAPAEGIAQVTGLVSTAATCTSEGLGTNCGLAVASTIVGATGSLGDVVESRAILGADSSTASLALRSQAGFGSAAFDLTGLLYQLSPQDGSGYSVNGRQMGMDGKQH